MPTALVTGSSGLIGSEVTAFFCQLGWEVHGVDNNMRADFFGPGGDTRWNQQRLLATLKGFHHHELDIRDRPGVGACLGQLQPDLVVHTAAQPSHDLAASRPFDDFDVNAVGTLNLLEATRTYVPASVFVHMSTNKVYGDGPNRIALRELPTRWDYDDPAYADGIAETFPIDQCKHSLFGASKVAADVMVQEYGRYFGLKCCVLRGGCLTGPNHSGVELHGFLSYLIKCNLAGKLYKVFGYQGKQVRDNIHALDVARFIHAFHEAPALRRGLQYRRRPGEQRVYSGSVRESGGSVGGTDAVRVRGQEPRGRPHLLHQQPGQDARPLPGLGPDQDARRRFQRDLSGVGRGGGTLKVRENRSLGNPL